MKTNLVKLLFEDSRSIDLNDQQHVRQNVIDRVGRLLAKKLNGQIPDEIEAKDLKSKLGLIGFTELKKLSQTVITGLKINPMQAKGAQAKGITQFDISKYEKLQVVPFMVLNREDKTLSGKKNDKDLYVLFFIPAIGIPIAEENKKIHQTIFKLDAIKDKNKTYEHFEIYDFPSYNITSDMLPKIQKSLMTGNLLGLYEMVRSNTGGKMRSNSSTEAPGKSNDTNVSKNDKEIKNIQAGKIFNKDLLRKELNMNELHKNSLVDLLFEDENKNALDIKNPKKVPTNKVNVTLENKIRIFLNKQFKRLAPAGWDESLSNKEKEKLVFKKHLGNIASATDIDNKLCKGLIGSELKLDAYNLDDQHKGTDPIDFAKFKKNQLMIFMLKDKEDMLLGAESAGGVESIYIVIVPPLYTKITDNNLAAHREVFGIKGKKKKGAAVWYESFKKCIIFQMSTDDKHAHKKNLNSFLTTSKISHLAKIAQKQAILKGTTLDLNSNKKDIQDNFVHKKSLSYLLFEADDPLTDEDRVSLAQLAALGAETMEVATSDSTENQEVSDTSSEDDSSKEETPEEKTVDLIKELNVEHNKLYKTKDYYEKIIKEYLIPEDGGNTKNNWQYENWAHSFEDTGLFVFDKGFTDDSGKLNFCIIYKKFIMFSTDRLPKMHPKLRNHNVQTGRFYRSDEYPEETGELEWKDVNSNDFIPTKSENITRILDHFPDIVFFDCSKLGNPKSIKHSKEIYFSIVAAFKNSDDSETQETRQDNEESADKTVDLKEALSIEHNKRYDPSGYWNNIISKYINIKKTKDKWNYDDWGNSLKDTGCILYNFFPNKNSIGTFCHVLWGKSIISLQGANEDGQLITFPVDESNPGESNKFNFQRAQHNTDRMKPHNIGITKWHNILFFDCSELNDFNSLSDSDSEIIWKAIANTLEDTRKASEGLGPFEETGDDDSDDSETQETHQDDEQQKSLPPPPRMPDYEKEYNNKKIIYYKGGEDYNQGHHIVFEDEQSQGHDLTMNANQSEIIDYNTIDSFPQLGDGEEASIDVLDKNNPGSKTFCKNFIVALEASQNDYNYIDRNHYNDMHEKLKSFVAEDHDIDRSGGESAGIRDTRPAQPLPPELDSNQWSDESFAPDSNHLYRGSEEDEPEEEYEEDHETEDGEERKERGEEDSWAKGYAGVKAAAKDFFSRSNQSDEDREDPEERDREDPEERDRKHRREFMRRGNKMNVDSKLASSILISKIKDNVKKSYRKPVYEYEIVDAVKNALTIICIGIVKVYDRERYNTAVAAADKSTLASKTDDAQSEWGRINRGEINMYTLFGYNSKARKRSKAHATSKSSIIKKLTGETITFGREEFLKKSVKEDVNSLKDFIISISKKAKSIDEHICKNKLVNLLFESAYDEYTIDIDKFKAGIKSSGALIYRSGLLPTTKVFKEAENYLIGTMADFVYTNFDIKVEGVEEYKKLNLASVEAGTMINQDAKVGQPASPAIEKQTSNAGTPKDIKAPFTIPQFLKLINSCGKDPMMAFMMVLLTNPDMVNKFKKLSETKGSLQDLVGILSSNKDFSSAAPNFLETLENQITEQRSNLQYISKTECNELYKILTLPGFTLSKNHKDKPNFKVNDQKLIVGRIQTHFNIVDSVESGSSPEEVYEMIYNLVEVIIFLYYNKLGAPEGSYYNIPTKDVELFNGSYVTSLYTAHCLAEYISKHENKEYSNKFRNDSIDELSDENDMLSRYGYYNSVNKEDIAKMLIKANGKDLFIEKVEESFETAKKDIDGLLSQLRESKFLKSKVLKRRKVSIISEAKFLEREYKRLWNLK